MQYFAISRNRDLTRLLETSTQLKFEVTVNFNGLNPHTIATSNQIKHRTSLSPLLVTSLQFTSINELPFDHQLGSMAFYTSISGLNYKTAF